MWPLLSRSSKLFVMRDFGVRGVQFRSRVMCDEHPVGIVQYAARLPDCVYRMSASDLAQNVKGVLPSNIGKVSLDKGRRE